MTARYRPFNHVDTFESRDRQRLLIFSRRTGELMLLVNRSADLWRTLNGESPLEPAPADRLVLESLRRRGFVEVFVETT